MNRKKRAISVASLKTDLGFSQAFSRLSADALNETDEFERLVPAFQEGVSLSISDISET
jgi:hypothetical protein